MPSSSSSSSADSSSSTSSSDKEETNLEPQDKQQPAWQAESEERIDSEETAEVVGSTESASSPSAEQKDADSDEVKSKKDEDNADDVSRQSINEFSMDDVVEAQQTTDLAPSSRSTAMTPNVNEENTSRALNVPSEEKIQQSTEATIEGNALQNGQTDDLSDQREEAFPLEIAVDTKAEEIESNHLTNNKDNTPSPTNDKDDSSSASSDDSSDESDHGEDNDQATNNRQQQQQNQHQQQQQQQNQQQHFEEFLPANALAFAGLVGQNKWQKRSGWIASGVRRPESVADHQYRMAMLAFLAPDVDSSLDVNRCIQMALIHDLAESIVGDIYPDEGIDKQDKMNRERMALNTIAMTVSRGSLFAYRLLPELFDEYEERLSPEAKFVKDLDNFERMVQAYEYENAQGVNLSNFFDSMQPDKAFHFPVVRAWYVELLEHRQGQDCKRPPPQRLTGSELPPSIPGISAFGASSKRSTVRTARQESDYRKLGKRSALKTPGRGTPSRFKTGSTGDLPSVKTESDQIAARNAVADDTLASLTISPAWTETLPFDSKPLTLEKTKITVAPNSNNSTATTTTNNNNEEQGSKGRQAGIFATFAKSVSGMVRKQEPVAAKPFSREIFSTLDCNQLSDTKSSFNLQPGALSSATAEAHHVHSSSTTSSAVFAPASAFPSSVPQNQQQQQHEGKVFDLPSRPRSALDITIDHGRIDDDECATAAILAEEQQSLAELSRQGKPLAGSRSTDAGLNELSLIRQSSETAGSGKKKGSLISKSSLKGIFTFGEEPAVGATESSAFHRSPSGGNLAKDAVEKDGALVDKEKREKKAEKKADKTDKAVDEDFEKRRRSLFGLTARSMGGFARTRSRDKEVTPSTAEPAVSSRSGNLSTEPAAPGVATPVPLLNIAPMMLDDQASSSTPRQKKKISALIRRFEKLSAPEKKAQAQVEGRRQSARYSAPHVGSLPNPREGLAVELMSKDDLASLSSTPRTTNEPISLTPVALPTTPREHKRSKSGARKSGSRIGSSSLDSAPTSEETTVSKGHRRRSSKRD